MELVDAHCHLQDERVPAEAVAGIISEAQARGVYRLVVNGCWPEDWSKVLQLARAHPGVILPQLGLHPWWVARCGRDWLKRLRKALEEHPTAGLGECGLDKGPKALAGASFEDQLAAFEAQLKLAHELCRPVSVHCVRAYGAVQESLTRLQLRVPGIVLHAWTGSVESTERLLQLPNVFFSLNGYLCKLPPHKALPMVRCIPLDRLLLESDAPDGLMQVSAAWLQALPQLAALSERLTRFREQGNTPAAVACTLEVVAAIRGEGKEAIAAATCTNAKRIFCGGWQAERAPQDAPPP